MIIAIDSAPLTEPSMRTRTSESLKLESILARSGCLLRVRRDAITLFDKLLQWLLQPGVGDGGVYFAVELVNDSAGALLGAPTPKDVVAAKSDNNNPNNSGSW